jgi:hypothetical protein
MELIAEQLPHTGRHYRKGLDSLKLQSPSTRGIHACSLPHVDSVEHLSKYFSEDDSDVITPKAAQACIDKHKEWMFGPSSVPLQQPGIDTSS